MNPLKAFMAGMVLPAVVLPFFYLILYLSALSAIREYPLQFAPLFIPLVFGLWNVLLVSLRGDENKKFWRGGLVLGFILALIGVFVIELPQLLFGLTGLLQYLPLLLVPLVYGVLWRYGITYLNHQIKV